MITATCFGNICTRLVAPPGLLEIRNEFVISDSGQPDDVAPEAKQWPVDDLPDDALIYLLGSRYCDTQKLSDQAWARFGDIGGGWQRVQAICDYVHDRISNSVTATPATTAPHPKDTPSGSAFAAISLISPSPSAAA